MVVQAVARIPAYQGVPLGNYPKTNVGKFENHGVDLSLGFTKQINKDWRVFAYGTFTWADNKVIDVAEAIKDEGYVYRHRTEGFPVGTQFGYVTDGYYNTQEELDAICAKCPLGQLYEDAEAQGLRIRDRSERALQEHIEGVRRAEDTLTALLGGHEALAYLAALRDGQILQENECEHYAAQIAEAGAAWETVLEGVSFEDLSRLRHLLREVDEYIKDGGELFNGFQHETERIPAHRLEELHQLGTALLGECPENDCTIYRNVFRMAVDVDGQMGKLTGHARETMQREYDRLLRELNRLYTMNHAVKKYREAQHDRT